MTRGLDLRPLPRRTERRFVSGLLGVLALVSASGCRGEAAEAAPRTLPHVRAAEVELVEPRPSSRHLVRLEPARRSRLAPRVGGEVIAIEVVEQSEVAEGDVLVRFEGSDPKGGLIAAKASVDRVQESILDTERELEAIRSLAARGAETSRAVERLETQRATLLAQLREARGQLVRARDRVGATAIVAPFAGTITRIETEVGEYMGPGAVALVLAQLDPLVADVQLTQDEVVLHDQGGLTFRVIARGRTVVPELEWISTEADERTSTFTARLRIPNPDRRLRAGELVDVEVRGPPREREKAVPATAVRWAADESYVLRLRGDVVERVDVRVGNEVDTLVAVEGPLQPGERVVAAGPTALLGGDKVKVVEPAPETLASD